MKRLLAGLFACLLLTGCSILPAEEAYVPTSGVQMDLSVLEPFSPPEEIAKRRSPERVEELFPGDYGLLRPYVGSRAAFDMTIYGGSGIYSGNLGLIDENGAIVVDPVYTDITYLYDWNRQDAPRFYRLSKQIQKDDYMDQIYGFCSLDGSVAQPCIYESVSCENGYIIAVERSKDGLFKIFDQSGQVLLDSASWETRPELYHDMFGDPVEATEHLLFLSEAVPGEEWNIVRRLYNWQGERIPGDYDWMELGAELPYACGTWDDWDTGFSGYVDAEGNPVDLGNLKRTGAFHFGQAVVTKDGVQCVIDTEGTVLWTAPEGYLSQNVSDTTVYYNHEISTDRAFVTCRWYNKDFQPMYPEAEYAHWLYDDWFVVWQDGVCSVTDGERSAVLEGAIPDREVYFDAFDTGAEDLLLITNWEDYSQKYWLFDRELKLLSHGVAEDPYVELLTDRTDGSAVAVTYDRMTYPNKYTVLDYPGAPALADVNILGIYNGWYMVEDEFSAGYMDKDGRWLFRVSLMADMTD